MKDGLKAAGVQRTSVEIDGKPVALRSLSARSLAAMADAGSESALAQMARLVSVSAVDDADKPLLTFDEALDLDPGVLRKLYDAAVPLNGALRAADPEG